ncbi:MAG: flagellar hook-associated protein FlgL [Chromatiales bacterium]|jgi:flagellar hook-associated protein 3 FlgL|nr:flagellar hook-associated protein FlgL [Chromatiales bacterium]
MRISTTQIQRSAMSSLLDQQAQIVRVQQQLSNGKRIQTPADDPAGAASLLGLRQSIQMTEQYQRNIDTVRTQLAQEESTLGSVTNVLDRIRELALAAANAALSASDRNAIAVEVTQRLKDLEGLANTMTPGGEYLFAGYQGLTRPFAVDGVGSAIYNGDSGQRLVQVSAERRVAVSDAGVNVFMAVPRGNGRFAAVAGAGNLGSGVIDTGSVSSAFGTGSYHISFPIATAAAVPLSFNDAGNSDDLGYSLSINGVEVYQINASGTPATTLDELATAINANSSATGVRALIDGDTLYLSNTSSSQAPISIVESLSGASDGDADSVTGFFGSVLTGNADTASIAITGGAATRYVVENDAGAAVAWGDLSSGGRISFSDGAVSGVQVNITGQPLNGDVFTLEPASTQDMFATVGDLLVALQSGAIGAELGNTINSFLANVDQAMERVRTVRADVGGRLNALDTQQDINADALLRLSTARSTLEDIDYASAISLFTQQMTALDAAYKAFSQIQSINLFNYVRA